METASCLPLLIVFDLDHTLWPFWVDTESYPFKKQGDKIVDSLGGVMRHYPDSPAILKRLHKQGIKIGVASRTPAIEHAKNLVNLFGWNEYISYTQIYPGSKIPHFKQIQKESGVKFSQMMFFDDEDRNIRDVGTLGVVCVHVPNGMSMKLLDDSLKRFAQCGGK